MFVLNALLLALLVAAACMPQIKTKRRKHRDELGVWRWIAVGTGALFPYSEVLLGFMGPGAAAQAYHGLTWSILLLPVYAFVLAEFIGVTAEVGWRKMWAPVVTGLLCAWGLAVLTEEGVFPFALLVDWRVGLSVLHGFDVILLGLCAMGVGMVYYFPAYARELARLSLFCVAVYGCMAAWWSVQARWFGEAYAQALHLDDVKVHVLPQAFLPLKWQVVVSEGNGRVHVAKVTMAHDRLDADAPLDEAVEYAPRERAVWHIYRRYGAAELPAEDQRQVRLAWYGWQATPFGWLGRYALFERFMTVPQVPGVRCAGFRDLRAMGSHQPAEGVYVVCPGRGAARVFEPVGSPNEQGQWRVMDEMIATMFAVKR